MVFVKLQKNKAYFKRFQTQFRRRREGKTDYYARKRLVVQDKNKYGTRRYRLVVRISNQYVLCQIVYATLQGDRVLAQAQSSELPRYGLKVGLKNYAAAYCTGLLVARRVLKKLHIDVKFAGDADVSGEVAEAPESSFRACLDVGIRRTTTGARLFGALKGAADGGLNVPHSHKRFPGYSKESKSYDASAHRDRIFGQHVAEYMKKMEEEDPEKYAKHFALYISNGVTADSIEDMYSKVHEAIRENPQSEAKKKFVVPDRKKFANTPKRTLSQRKSRVAQKKASHVWKLQQAAAASADE